tara:strand:+ start:4414 stop:5265 length:852 start_codon:yes stop_codon:yes gene_type:complete
MHHPAELAIHQYLENAKDSKTEMSDATIDKVCDDIRSALKRQFNSGEKRDKFRLRMSNVGRPYCQLWYDKNKPDVALPKPTTFVMNMMIGDIVEAVFKAILTEAKVKFKDSEQVELKLKDGSTIKGTTDLEINDAIDDVKSASDWSYKHKFKSFQDLDSMDDFGYVAQLAGYAKAAGKEAGGWWVVNKANGDFKYVKSDIDIDNEYNKIQKLSDKIKENKFTRCFEPVRETFYGKETGNTILSKSCGFCNYKQDCWEGLQSLPAVKSKAKEPKIVDYVSMGNV